MQPFKISSSQNFAFFKFAGFKLTSFSPQVTQLEFPAMAGISYQKSEVYKRLAKSSDAKLATNANLPSAGCLAKDLYSTIEESTTFGVPRKMNEFVPLLQGTFSKLKTNHLPTIKFKGILVSIRGGGYPQNRSMPEEASINSHKSPLWPLRSFPLSEAKPGAI